MEIDALNNQRLMGILFSFIKFRMDLVLKIIMLNP